MQGLMMDYPLTIPAILHRADTIYGHKPIITRLPDKSIHRYTYSAMALRSRKLSAALQKLGILKGDRVATLSWNHYQHLETYFAVPSIGAVLHTLNLRLSPDDLSYIITHAEDKVIIVDQVLLPLYDKFKSKIKIDHLIVIPQTGQPIPEGALDYEKLISSADEKMFVPFNGDEHTAAAMCYTSGTTGNPKGVLYSHRSVVLHSMASSFADGLGLKESDTMLPVVPMFHVNAWGLPFTCTLLGTAQVLPGPYLDAVSLLDLLEKENVTITAGVPTIWLGILNELDTHPGKYKLSSLRMMVVGGAAAPRSMIVGFEERHGLNVLHAWGMTETSPVGSISFLAKELQNQPKETQYNYRAKQGLPACFVEVRGRNENGLIRWDGETMGELEVRGPWVARSYYNSTDMDDRFTEDGWFKTGDIVTIEANGYIEIKDRSKDVIKSGGEWISSVSLEGAIMGHPAVAEAAVFAIPDAKWQERPMACVVLKPGKSATHDEIIRFLEPQYTKIQLPDKIEFVTEIPKTSVGKFKKSALRELYKHMGS
ncbi:MAG: Long-chain-fatty-acid--CoA ligase [Cytophagales bacterium]|jgi:fatty-acyl-CoA synthase|nr:long-chain fatty acid--CoA ligase [Bacteroidota bacterium]MBS1981235.1 long-chain fatty acid--CoA ligase [Bacteroidota bacterium]WHZ06513.1 MAG: Long-chain-fatty-acid--CoA ligase [Cytophagales bacterium]